MTYQQYGKIEASDYNSIVGLASTSTSGELNAIWGTGNGNKGYGQPAISQVAQNATVGAAAWANVTNTTSTIANHQNTSILSVTTPTQNARVDYLNQIPTNINTITATRLNAVAQGTTTTYSKSTTAAWSDSITFVQTITFASGDNARYFFNSGGQIAISFASPSGTGINALMNSLASNCGTIVLSANTSGTVSIGGVSYNGITKVGGSGTLNTNYTISNDMGYYALGTADSVVFRQTATGDPSGYLQSNITVKIRTNGTQNSNGDNGSQIIITTIWDEIPNGLAVSSGGSTSITVRPPSTTYLSNSWGTPTYEGTVTGS